MSNDQTCWIPKPRYPDAAIEVLDQIFLNDRLMNASVERLATGTRWVERPVWFSDGRYLLWSDIPNDGILRWDEMASAAALTGRAVRR
ncbi:MAG: hypothetical protein ACRYGP_07835 [Janthinobacterium lividum]